MTTAEVTNRLEEISVASSRKSFNLKRIFGHSNLQKNKKEDIEAIDKQIEKTSTPRNIQVENDVGPTVSVEKTSAPTNCAINIEVPKQSHVAILFSFSNLFSLERKVILTDEKIDPDDVATSPLHDNDDGSREVYSWSTPTESCFQEFLSSRPEYEFTEVVEADDKSPIPSITQNESVGIEEDTAGLTGEIVTSRCSDTVIECNDKTHDGVQNSKLQCDVSDVSTINNSSPLQKRSFRKLLSKISNNMKRIIDKSKPSVSTAKAISDDSSLEDGKKNKVDIPTIAQGENCEEIEVQRASLEVSPSFEATGNTLDTKSNSYVSNKMSNCPVPGPTL